MPVAICLAREQGTGIAVDILNNNIPNVLVYTIRPICFLEWLSEI